MKKSHIIFGIIIVICIILLLVILFAPTEPYVTYTPGTKITGSKITAENEDICSAYCSRLPGCTCINYNKNTKECEFLKECKKETTVSNKNVVSGKIEKKPLIKVKAPFPLPTIPMFPPTSV